MPKSSPVFAFPRILAVLSVMALVLLATGIPVAAQEGNRLGEGSDLEIGLGSPGNGEGQFHVLRSITFSPADCLYTLEGREKENGAGGAMVATGNCRVQKFDDTGKFISQFSLLDESLDADKNDTYAIAVDSQGQVYVTRPVAGTVQQYSPDGKLLKTIPWPGASAITLLKGGGKERVAVVANSQKPTSDVLIVNTDGSTDTPLTLGQPVTNCQSAASDSNGNLYLEAAIYQVYKFDATGKLLDTIGGGTSRKNDDGSEFFDGIAIGPTGELYGHNSGNPANYAKFSPDFSTVSLNKGQFRWGDSWYGRWNSTSFMAVDKADRLWVAVPVEEKKGDQKSHFVPCVLRTSSDFFDKNPAVSALGIGLKAKLEGLDRKFYTYDGGPVQMELIVPASYRRVNAIDVSCDLLDDTGKVVDNAKFTMKLENNKEGRQTFSLTPPALGLYTAKAALSAQGTPLLSNVEITSSVVSLTKQDSHAIAKEIRDLTGARTKIAWIRSSNAMGHLFGPGLQDGDMTIWRIVVLDTDENGGQERYLTPEFGAYGHLQITPNGQRVLWTSGDVHGGSIWVSNWDGTNQHKLLDGPALSVGASEDANKTEWVYVMDESATGEIKPVYRYQIDDVTKKELVWNKTASNDKWEISRDGKWGASGFPWPQAGVAQLPNGDFHNIGVGCTPGSDGTHFFNMKAENHPGIYLYDMDGSNKRYIDFASHAPGTDVIQGGQFWWCGFAKYDGRFFTFAGPNLRQQYTPGGGHVYFCEFNANYDNFDKWIMVTNDPNTNTTPIAWIDPQKTPPAGEIKVTTDNARPAETPPTTNVDSHPSQTPTTTYDINNPSDVGAADFAKNNQELLKNGADFVVKQMDCSIGPVKQLSLYSARPNDSANTEITYLVTFATDREVGVTLIGSKDNWRVSSITSKTH